jgi:hypothetical protein
MSALPPKADIHRRERHVRFCAQSGHSRKPSPRADLPLLKLHESQDSLGFVSALSFARFEGYLENVSGGLGSERTGMSVKCQKQTFG